MKKHLFQLVSVFMVLFLASCTRDDSLIKMEQIKAFGDSNPNQALAMLDSLEVEIRGKNDYIRNKYDLLRIRLNDKAYIIPTSDIMIKKLGAASGPARHGPPLSCANALYRVSIFYLCLVLDYNMCLGLICPSTTGLKYITIKGVVSI